DPAAIAAAGLSPATGLQRSWSRHGGLRSPLPAASSASTPSSSSSTLALRQLPHQSSPSMATPKQRLPFSTAGRSGGWRPAASGSGVLPPGALPKPYPFVCDPWSGSRRRDLWWWCGRSDDEEFIASNPVYRSQLKVLLESRKFALAGAAHLGGIPFKYSKAPHHTSSTR
ncbi:hypothetical protein EJB05_16385, partial [Eragrostis curvula]